MRLFLVILLSLLAIGCRSKPRVQRETALLRAEILDLEDKYYLLKSKYDGVVNQVGEGETYYEGIIYEGDVIHNDIAPYEQSNEKLDSPMPRSDQNGPVNSERLPSPKSDTDQSNSMLDSRMMLGSSDIQIALPDVNGKELEVTGISINRDTTQGRDVDDIPGDDGIDLLVQQETSSGQVAFQTGELTVSLIDPAESSDRQRIGLWKFLPDETKLFFANDERGNRGILLHLPWDQSTPTNEELTLHVRFVTKDGHVLKTSGPLRINPPARGYSTKNPDVAKWTREDKRWIPAPDLPTTPDNASRWRTPTSSDAAPALKEAIKRPVWRPIR